MPDGSVLCMRQPTQIPCIRLDTTIVGSYQLEIRRLVDSSSMNAWRIARHDTVLGGRVIKAGQVVVVWMEAANFDETYFPQSLQFDIRRSPNPHLTFGYSVHACLGSSLARLEGRIALERIVAHFSDIRPDPENPVQFMAQMTELIESLGIFFTPVGR